MATYLIVGANRGIGLALCHRLSHRGDQVIATCRTAAPDLRALAVHVEESVDITSDASVQELVKRLGSARIDVLVLNAGLMINDDLASVRLEDVRAQLETNSIGALRVVLALHDRLAHGGKVILITSRMGSIGDNTSGGHYGYRMSKAALNAAGMSLARDLAGRGIAVGILHPGYVRTALTGGKGHIDAGESARDLIHRMDELTLLSTGAFLHANGDPLPW